MTRAARLADDVLLTADGRLVGDAAGAEVVELRMLLREDLAGLDEPKRRQIVDAVAMAGTKSSQPMRLRHGMHQVREALRERWPTLDDVRGNERGLHVDGLLRIDEWSFYVYGWTFE